MCGRPSTLSSKKDFAELSGVFRLATKYEADSLRSRALLPFQRVYPSTLAEWDRVLDCRPASFIWFFDPVVVINLARETSAFSLLPAAMAYLTNGSSAREAFAVSVFETIPLRFSPGLLAGEDAKGFALMKENDFKAIARTMKLIRDTGNNPRPNCIRANYDSTSIIRCAAKFLNLLVVLSQLLVLSETQTGYSNFIFTVQRILEKEDICDCCRQGFELAVTREREAWWKDLPCAVGFAGWGDVRLDVRGDDPDIANDWI